MTHDPGSGHLSIATLFNTLMHDVTLLFRKEFELARSELSWKAAQMSNGAALIAAAAVAGLGALLFLMTAATFALALVVEAWAAALIVGGIAGITAALLYAVGRNRLKGEHLYPERTVRTLRDDAEFTRRQMRGG